MSTRSDSLRFDRVGTRCTRCEGGGRCPACSGTTAGRCATCAGDRRCRTCGGDGVIAWFLATWLDAGQISYLLRKVREKDDRRADALRGDGAEVLPFDEFVGRERSTPVPEEEIAHLGRAARDALTYGCYLDFIAFQEAAVASAIPHSAGPPVDDAQLTASAKAGRCPGAFVRAVRRARDDVPGGRVRAMFRISSDPRIPPVLPEQRGYLHLAVIVGPRGRPIVVRHREPSRA